MDSLCQIVSQRLEEGATNPGGKQQQQQQQQQQQSFNTQTDKRSI